MCMSKGKEFFGLYVIIDECSLLQDFLKTTEIYPIIRQITTFLRKRDFKIKIRDIIKDLNIKQSNEPLCCLSHKDGYDNFDI